MPNLPTPIRAALGLAATAVDEARKLPETVPHIASSVPILAVSTAMQASLRLQQHLATLTARGDEVLSQLRGNSAEPPSWATFDDSPEDGAADPQAGKAAFDRIDYESTGFAEGSDEEEGKGRWDAVGVGGTQPEADPVSDAGPSADSATDGLDGGLTYRIGDELLDQLAGDVADTAEVTATPPSAAGPTPPAPDLAEAVAAPDLPVTKAAPGKATKAAKSAPAKSVPAKATPAKATPAKAAPAKAAPAKAAKRAGRKEPDHEPLEVAASKAKPSATPNPATMAAEILHAHEAESDDE